MKMKNVRTISFVAVVLFLCACPAFGTIYFKDGLTHNIDYRIDDSIFVDYQAPLMYTTVNWLAGGSNYFHNLDAYEQSRINIRGGYINGLISHNSSQVDMSGGLIDGIRSFGSSHVSISGGTIWDLSSDDFSQVNISGGSMWHLRIYDSSQVNISGGSISGYLYLWDQSNIQIFGSDFAVDGQLVGYGELISTFGGDPENEPIRHLTGTLLSGELIDTNFRIGYDARIVLIPEPATIALFGLGVFFLRKRQEER
jgi:hypothetical protein